MQSSGKVLVHDVLMVECLHHIRICERIVTLEQIIVCSANAGDVIGFVKEPSSLVVGNDDLGSSTEVWEDIRLALL